MFSTLISSLLIVIYTLFNIISYGSITWVEPNNLILYSEMIMSIFVLYLVIYYYFIKGEILRT